MLEESGSDPNGFFLMLRREMRGNRFNDSTWVSAFVSGFVSICIKSVVGLSP